MSHEPAAPVLILFAHPALEKSRVNRVLAAAVSSPVNVPGFRRAGLTYETFELSENGNYEILVEWLTIAAGSAYEPALPAVRRTSRRWAR